MGFQVPTEEKKWIQSNKSDVFGNLWATWNMDFDTIQGKVRVAPRLRINTDEGDDADLGLPYAFVRSSADNTDRWWALCGGVLFKTTGTNPSAAFTQDAIANSPTTAAVSTSDMVEFNGKLYVSLSTDIAEMESGTWTVSWWRGTLAQAALTASISHAFHVTKKTNLLLISNGNVVHVVTTAETVSASRIVLPTEFRIEWIRSSDNGTWIGANNLVSRQAEAFFWDESAENYNSSYKLKSDVTFAGIIKDGLPYTVNGEAQLLRFSGAGFDEVAVFPVFGQQDLKLSNVTTGSIPTNIHRNGMAVIENKIHILVSSIINNADARFMPNFPTGVWNFDEERGLTHKYSVSQYDGTEIDYGSMHLVEVGALVPTNKQQGLFLAGADVFTNATLDTNAILFRDATDAIVKRGHFVTSVFEASAFEDVFQDLLVTFKRFRNANDRIIVKYRTIKNINFPNNGNTGTWSDTDTFTSTDGLSAVAAGDEIMIVRGRGAGTTAHVDTITFSSPTYTVNLTETIANASGTFIFNVDDWTRCATISTQSIERQGFNLDVAGTFLQLKVELRSAAGTARTGDSPELEKIVVTNKPEIET